MIRKCLTYFKAAINLINIWAPNLARQAHFFFQLYMTTPIPLLDAEMAHETKDFHKFKRLPTSSKYVKMI